MLISSGEARLIGQGPVVSFSVHLVPQHRHADKGVQSGLVQQKGADHAVDDPLRQHGEEVFIGDRFAGDSLGEKEQEPLQLFVPP